MVAEGETTIEPPLPSGAPPQLTEYHTHVAPVPNDPPATFSVVELPSHIGSVLADTLTGAVDRLFTVTVTLTQAVVLQVPSART